MADDKQSMQESLTNLSRRKILKSSAVTMATPAMAAASGAGQSSPSGTKKTNGDPNAPSQILTGKPGKPIPAAAVENVRKAMLKQNKTKKRGLIGDNPATKDKSLLAYGLRLEDGVPVEYRSSIDATAGADAVDTATKMANENVVKFGRGEL